MTRLCLLILLATINCSCAVLSIPDVKTAKESLYQGDVMAAERQFQALSSYSLSEREMTETQYMLAKIKDYRGDTANAAKHYREVANQKPAALKSLVRLFNEAPTLVQPSDCEAIKTLAESGSNTDAALFLSSGHCKQVDTKKWLITAAQKGHVDAVLALAKTGPEGSKLATNIAFKEPGNNPQKPYQLVSKLASLYDGLGDTAALNDLRHRAESLVLPAQLQLDLAKYKPQEEALEVYRKLKNSVADAALGIVTVGVKTPQLVAEAEFQEAMTLARQDAAIHDQAVLLEARMYTWGLRGLQDPEVAMKLLSSLENSPDAQYLEGQIYRHGFLGEAKPSMAIPLLKSAAYQGSKDALLALAEIYAEGRIVCQNMGLSKQYRQLVEELYPTIGFVSQQHHHVAMETAQ